MLKYLIIISLCYVSYSAELPYLREAAKLELSHEEKFTKLFNATSIYLSKHSSAQEANKFAKKLSQRLDQAEKDRENYSEENYIKQVLLDFCSDNQEEIKNTEKISKEKLIYACYLFRFMYCKRYSLPENISSNLTPEVIEKVVKYLREN